jgi:hypothetical protein
MKFFFLILIISFFIQSCGDNTAKIEQSSLPINATNAKTDDKIYQNLTFKNLNSFKILQVKPNELYSSENDDVVDQQVPLEVKELNDKEIEITGFAFPIKLVEGKTSKLVLMAVNPKCCFGDVLKINDMIYVDLSKDIKKIKNGQSVHVKGKIKVGMQDVDAWNSKFLYVMSADEVILAENKIK